MLTDEKISIEIYGRRKMFREMKNVIIEKIKERLLRPLLPFYRDKEAVYFTVWLLILLPYAPAAHMSIYKD